MQFHFRLLTTVLNAANSSGRQLTFYQTYLPAQYLGSLALHSLLRHLLWSVLRNCCSLKQLTLLHRIIRFPSGDSLGPAYSDSGASGNLGVCAGFDASFVGLTLNRRTRISQTSQTCGPFSRLGEQRPEAIAKTLLRLPHKSSIRNPLSLSENICASVPCARPHYVSSTSNLLGQITMAADTEWHGTGSDTTCYVRSWPSTQVLLRLMRCILSGFIKGKI